MALHKRARTLPLHSHAAVQMKMPIRYSGAWIAILVAADLTMFVVASYVAGALSDHTWSLYWAKLRFWHSSIIFVAIWLMIFQLLGLYRRSFALSIRDEFYFTLVALVLGVMPQFVAFTLMPSLSSSRLVLLLATLLAIVFVGSVRGALHALRGREQEKRGSRILVAGSYDQAEILSERLERAGGIEVIFAGSARSRNPGLNRWDISEYVRKADELRCERLVLTEVPSPDEIYKLMEAARRRGIALYLPLPETYSRVFRLTIDRKGEQAFVVPVPPTICSPVARLAKRILDIGVTSVLIVLLSPLIVLAALLVAGGSGMPILYRQERVGRDGRIFNILKFRTMRQDAGSEWAQPGDARITPIGAFLRRTSLDELPQLFNVLKGEMSLVGPRPEMREFEDRFAETVDSYAERRLALPGITGWAQVHLKRNLTPEDVHDVLAYDLFYIEHWSLFLDLGVLFKTGAEFLFHRAV